MLDYYNSNFHINYSFLIKTFKTFTLVTESDPLILINGVRNDKALTKVRYEVCKAIPVGDTY